MAHFLRSILIILILSFCLEAKDLGTYGATTFIKEENLMEYLQQKMKSLSKKEMNLFFEKIKENLEKYIHTPMEICGIQKVQSYSIAYLDPSIIVDRDIIDHHQQIIVKKGTNYNPLSQVCMKQALLFFDATDPQQLTWAESQPNCKWILIKGSPLQLEERLQRPIYFDQGGLLTRKLKINKVPARVSQEGLKLKIEFVSMEQAIC